MEPAEARDTPFARALRQAIVERKWTHRAAGDALGVSHTQIGRYLTGAAPSLPTARLLAEQLGVSLDRLAGRGLLPDRSQELADQILEAAETQLTLATALREIARDVGHLEARAPDASGTG